MSYTNLKQAPVRIATETPFVGNSLRGDVHEHGRPVECGRLPLEYYADVRFARYIVWSYATPIGWITADGAAIVPDEKYSVTTSKHQNVVRRALV